MSALDAVKDGDRVVVKSRRGEPIATVVVVSTLGAVITDSNEHRWAKKDGKRLPRNKGNETFIDVISPEQLAVVERGMAESAVFRFYDRMRRQPPVDINHMRRVLDAINSAEIPPVKPR